MSCQNEKKRIIIKQGSGVPTVPSSSDHTDGTWIATDIYPGEQYQDTNTGLIYTSNGSITYPISQITELYSGYVNDTLDGSAGAFQTFDLGTTINFPSGVQVGEGIQITAVVSHASAPASNGTGVYFHFYNTEYIPVAASTPTYGNSFWQLPYTEDRILCELTIYKLDSTNGYTIAKQRTLNTSLGGTSTEGSSYFFGQAMNWSGATEIRVEALLENPSQAKLEWLSIKRISA